MLRYFFPDYFMIVRREIQRWRRTGIIRAETANLLETSCPAPLDHHYLRIILLSAIPFAAGAAWLIHSAWRDFSRFDKFLVSAAVLALVYLAGFLLKFERRRETAGEAVILLATLLYGGVLFLMARTFDIHGATPTCLVLWALGVWPLAVINRSVPQFVLAAAIVAALAGWRVFAQGRPTELLLEVGLLVIYPLAYIYYRTRAARAVAAAVPVLYVVQAVWLETTRFTPLPVLALPALGVLYIMLGHWHRAVPLWKSSAVFYRLPGILLLLLPAVALSLPAVVGMSDLPHLTIGRMPRTMLAGSAALAAVALAVAMPARFRLATRDRLRLAALAATVAAAGAGYRFFLPEFRHLLAETPLVLPIAGNAVLLAGLILLIISGRRSQDRLLTGTGLLTLGLVLVARLSGLLVTLPAPVFMMAASLLILAVGLALERARRTLLSSRIKPWQEPPS